MITDLLRSRVVSHLQGLRRGSLVLEDDRGRVRFGGHERPDLRATIRVHSPRLYHNVALRGSLGAAESYLEGHWTADDLTNALRIFAANLEATGRIESPLTRLLTLPATLGHRLRGNSRRGSRRNIRDHYDLGNAFFAQFLDDTMTYSCGVFESPHADLQAASVAKLDRVCRKLALQPADHVLEIGTGWGSFAVHAASRYGCRVTTTTISEAQYETAAARVREAGLAERVTLLRRDYRDLSGTFDKLASIEMIEAVGAEHLPGYFGHCARLLAPHGQMLLQGIVLPEHRYGPYLTGADFIQRYVFPGSALTSVGAMSAAIGRATDFRMVQMEDLSSHYARTLHLWRRRFLSRLEEVRHLGYDERFIRTWDYYLAYCEAGFSEACTGVVQVLLARPGCPVDAVADVGPAGAVPLPLAG
ncbi:MAG: class I SAM-dependent methyltransferase [Acidobacteria bacterium]|nr:class I SAM-dependent methyltransferase [Acidobacteriota bacterium]